MPNYHYKAFISYSHQDEHWAMWLQHALENYRIPSALIGKQGSFGDIPARLGLIFRDREDLSSSDNLTESISQELAAAETLVVVCSPAAAQSKWVNEEIKAFKKLGRSKHIYALIVGGDPQAASEQCFPSALIESDNGSVHEPLAADARSWADGKNLAKLKLVAGILGVRLDELREREMHRRRRNWILSGVAVTAVVISTTILLVTAISNQNMAEQRRASTEELIGFMLGNLEELSPVSGLDILDEDQNEMVRVAQKLGFDSFDDATLLRQALDWRDEGKALQGQGNSKATMTALGNSLSAIIHLYQRDTKNTTYLFEVGQAEYWVGYEHLDQGELDLAEKSMTRYGVIARRLINADPKSAENVLELSYTLVNLAAIEIMRVSGDHLKALRMMQAALEYNQLAIVLEPNNPLYMVEMAGAQAWLADTWLGICNLQKANQIRSENVSLEQQMLTLDPDNMVRQLGLAYALANQASVQDALGLTEVAINTMRKSEKEFSELSTRQPDNDRYSWGSALAQEWIARKLINTGRVEEAEKLIAQSVRVLAQPQAQSNELERWKKQDLAYSWASQSLLAQKQGRLKNAAEFNLKAVELLFTILSESPDSMRDLREFGAALFLYWQLNGELPKKAWQALIKAPSANEAPGEDTPSAKSCSAAEFAARQGVMYGDLVSAKLNTDYLLNRGLKSASFMLFCRAYSLCR